MLPRTSGTRSATRTRDLPSLTWWWIGRLRCRWFTRATSNCTTPRRSGTRKTGSRSGPAPRARSASGRKTAGILKVDESRIKVNPVEIGGGFGGKTVVYLPPVAAVLSRKTHRPVKMIMDRRSVFEGSGPAPGGKIRVRMGVTNEGKIRAADADIRFEAGAFPRLGRHRRRDLHSCLLQHPGRSHRRTRRGDQQAQVGCIQGAGFAAGCFRCRAGSRRDLRQDGLGQDSVPPRQRVAGGDSQGGRSLRLPASGWWRHWKPPVPAITGTARWRVPVPTGSCSAGASRRGTG